MAIEQAVFGGWPGGAQVAVALTFDVDGEAPWLSEGPEYERRLTMRSQGQFGPEEYRKSRLADSRTAGDDEHLLPHRLNDRVALSGRQRQPHARLDPGEFRVRIDPRKRMLAFRQPMNAAGHA